MFIIVCVMWSFPDSPSYTRYHGSGGDYWRYLSKLKRKYVQLTPMQDTFLHLWWRVDNNKSEVDTTHYNWHFFQLSLCLPRTGRKVVLFLKGPSGNSLANWSWVGSLSLERPFQVHLFRLVVVVYLSITSHFATVTVLRKDYSPFWC